MSETYRTVTTKVWSVRPNSIGVDPAVAGPMVWIPRSLIHGVDDLKVSKLFVGEEFTFRLMDWKAEELGFA